jgi:hypothetical protein
MGGMMKLLRSALLTIAVAAGLAGCTYSDPVSERGSAQSVPSSSSSPTSTAVAVTLRGRFQSQGAITTGTATIRVTGSGAVLQIDDFATGTAKDLRLALSPGILGPGSDGEPGLSSSTLIELGPLSQSGSQRVDMDSRMWAAMPEPVRSVVIYSYADKTAYGTANLTEAQGS